MMQSTVESYEDVIIICAIIAGVVMDRSRGIGEFDYVDMAKPFSDLPRGFGFLPKRRDYTQSYSV